MNRYCRENDLDDMEADILEKLKNVICTERLISYFEETEKSLDKVLKIFIRVNSGGTKLSYSDPQTGENFIPYVIETAMGVNRAMLAVMIEAYEEEDLGDGKTRTVLKLKPWLSPVKAAVIPLARNVPELLNISNDIVARLRKLGIGRIELENSGNIGKNYRRHDEIGTPVCITVDHQTMEDNTVTLRYRDTMEQVRVPVDDVVPRVLEIINE